MRWRRAQVSRARYGNRGSQFGMRNQLVPPALPISNHQVILRGRMPEPHALSKALLGLDVMIGGVPGGAVVRPERPASYVMAELEFGQGHDHSVWPGGSRSLSTRTSATGDSRMRTDQSAIRPA